MVSPVWVLWRHWLYRKKIYLGKTYGWMRMLDGRKISNACSVELKPGPIDVGCFATFKSHELSSSTYWPSVKFKGALPSGHVRSPYEIHSASESKIQAVYHSKDRSHVRARTAAPRC